MTTKKIFSRKMALELRKRGFRIVGTEPNFYKPQFDVYLFQETEKLHKAITEISNNFYS